jgi:c-di-GMP-binding flagellar brake protein YcgR
MFRIGKVLKVKVELSPEVVGFGRATILASDGGRIFLQLKTSKGDKRNLPKGTRVWFVSDSADNPFNGLWSTTILSTRNMGGKTALECARPKFEAVVQRRKQKRVHLNCAVRLQGELYETLDATTRNLSRSGVGIEISDDCVDVLKTGHHLDFVIDSPFGPITVKGRVIQSRYNWLANRTDVGIEFVKVPNDGNDTLERLLLSLGGQARLAPEGKEKGTARGGQLSGWLKSTKDNVSFVKTAEAAQAVLSEEDLDELDPDDEETAGEDVE